MTKAMFCNTYSQDATFCIDNEICVAGYEAATSNKKCVVIAL